MRATPERSSGGCIPHSCCGLAVDADLHWVKVGFVIDAAVKVDRHGFDRTRHQGRRAHRGSARPRRRPQDGAASPRSISAELKGDFAKPLAAVGEIQVSNLTAAQIADGTDLGGYVLHVLADGAVGTDGSVTAQVIDTGGPLEAQAASTTRRAIAPPSLTGTLRERPRRTRGAAQPTRKLAQLRGRDRQGRIPVDFEFTSSAIGA